MPSDNRCKAPGCSKKATRTQKTLCESHYMFLRKYGQFEPPPKLPDATHCCVEGCQKSPRSRVAKYCEQHYYQIRRNGYLGLKRRPKLIDHSEGYQLLKAPHHPLTTPGQQFRVYEHRAEFYRVFGNGPFHCISCGDELDWKDACVCRQNSDRADNEVDNLEIRCRSCRSKKAFDAAAKTLADKHYHWIEWNGERKNLKDWAESLNLTPGCLYRRIKLGWTTSEALSSSPKKPRKRRKRTNLSAEQVDEIRSLADDFAKSQIAEAYGISSQTVTRILSDPNWG